MKRFLVHQDINISSILVHTELPCSVCVCARACALLCLTLQTHGLKHSRLLCPWNFPGKNTGVGCHFLLQGIISTQGWNLCFRRLLQRRQILYHEPLPPLYTMLYLCHCSRTLRLSILSSGRPLPYNIQEHCHSLVQVLYWWACGLILVYYMTNNAIMNNPRLITSFYLPDCWSESKQRNLTNAKMCSQKSCGNFHSQHTLWKCPFL